MNPHRRRFFAVAGAAIAAAGLTFTVQAAEKVKIAIIGSGDVGSAIGAVWVKAGHEVMFSSRHLEHDESLAARLGAGARAGTPHEAAAFGAVVKGSVPNGAQPDVGKDVGVQLDGKVGSDTCNPFPYRDGDIAGWARGGGAGRASAELLPGARLVRAFNAIGAARMGSAHKEPGRVGMPIAGDDAEAVELASRLIREIGYEPVVIGDLEMGKHLVPGTPFSGEQTPDEIRRLAADL
jgi:predicted dinucleotide-binding enzyme